MTDEGKVRREAKVKRILCNSYVAVPLGVTIGMLFAVGWSLTQEDRLVVNQTFVASLLVIPLFAAGYSLLVGPRASWFRRILTWAGTTALGVLAAFVVFFASGIVIPPP